jgi:hypothetical protein
MPEADSHPESNQLSHHFHTYFSPLFILLQMYILFLWSLFQPAQHVLIILFASKMALQQIVKEKYHDLLKKYLLSMGSSVSAKWITDVFSTVPHRKISMFSFHVILWHHIPIGSASLFSNDALRCMRQKILKQIYNIFKSLFHIVMSKLMLIFTL